MAYKAKAQMQNEARIIHHLSEQRAPDMPWSGPIGIHVQARFRVPKSYSVKRTERCLLGHELQNKKPDLDNIIKNILDCGQKILFNDDKQVCFIMASKNYHDKPGWIIEVWECGEEPS